MKRIILFAIFTSLILGCSESLNESQKPAAEKAEEENLQPIAAEKSSESKETGSTVTSRLGERLDQLAQSKRSGPQKLRVMVTITIEESQNMASLAGEGYVTEHEMLGFVSYVDSIMFVLDAGVIKLTKENSVLAKTIKEEQKEVVEAITELANLFAK